MTNVESSLLETTVDDDYSNFTYLNSWTNHYKSWKNNSIFKTLFVKFEDLQNNNEETYKKIILLIKK